MSRPESEPIQDHGPSEQAHQDQKRSTPMQVGIVLGLIVFFNILREGREGAWPVAVVTALGVWILSTAILLFLVKYWKLLVLVVGSIGGSWIAALSTNPQCVVPLEQDQVEEMGLCLVISVGAEPLAPLEGVFSLQGRRDISGEVQGWSLESVALAGPTNREPPSQAPLSREQVFRFNQCATSLYEDPALLLETRLVKRGRLARPIAQDIVMGTLLKVCQRYMDREIQDLEQYYRKAVRNESITVIRDTARTSSLDFEQEDATEQEDPLTQRQEQWFKDALGRLNPVQQRVLRRWQEGGSWLTISKELGISYTVTTNAFHNGLARIKQMIEQSESSYLQAVEQWRKAEQRQATLEEENRILRSIMQERELRRRQYEGGIYLDGSWGSYPSDMGNSLPFDTGSRQGNDD